MSSRDWLGEQVGDKTSGPLYETFVIAVVAVLAGDNLSKGPIELEVEAGDETIAGIVVGGADTGIVGIAAGLLGVRPIMPLQKSFLPN